MSTTRRSFLAALAAIIPAGWLGAKAIADAEPRGSELRLENFPPKLEEGVRYETETTFVTEYHGGDYVDVHRVRLVKVAADGTRTPAFIPR